MMEPNEMTTPLYSSYSSDLAQRLTELRPDLLRYCRSLAGMEWEAEDLVQEAMIRVLNRHGKAPQITVSKAYVFRIARNLWIDRCRLHRRQASLSFEELEPADAPAAPADSDPLITREMLEELMYRLTPKPFVIVLLCDVFGMTAKEAGFCINMAEGSVQVALSRARKRLRLLALREPERTAAGAYPMQQSRVGATAKLLASVTDAFRRHDPRLIYDAYLRLFENGCRIAEIHSRDGRYFFTLHDPDGNLLLISESFF
ncbi:MULTISPECIES: RNA polymerase sigma factor [Paenibacillus]|uniref:RNA polymerase sigma factor n=1 Tax=Paenibacillus albilobatus TaxID=2716884 RepID=A0A920CCG6_9BACL|nr:MULTISPECIES: sigma-70 family RNA polymerase sigma factor [Paenibacillus]GIO34540.1 hypothetical protein J2TS6_56810 [Paenibacillus albilobatus]